MLWIFLVDTRRRTSPVRLQDNQPLSGTGGRDSWLGYALVYVLVCTCSELLSTKTNHQHVEGWTNRGILFDVSTISGYAWRKARTRGTG